VRADLHIHTTASDGSLSPEALVRRAAAIGLDIIAITDHDTIEGIASAIEAAKEFPQLIVIPGVEISAEPQEGEAHILGYFLDYTNKNLIDTLNELRTARIERCKKMVYKLNELGMKIEWDRVEYLGGLGQGSVGRPHIAQALVEAGYVSSLREAFQKYIGRDCPAYVPRKKVTSIEAIHMICNAGGMAVLAHPADIKDLGAILVPLIEAGLKGLEVYYGGYSEKTISNLVKLAREYGLVISGGSDYHGLDDSVGKDLGSIEVPEQVIKEFIACSKHEDGGK